MQVTLVDCPGHASLIRTIIGGTIFFRIYAALVWQSHTRCYTSTCISMHIMTALLSFMLSEYNEKIASKFVTIEKCDLYFVIYDK